MKVVPSVIPACDCAQRRADISFAVPAELGAIEAVATAISQFAAQNLPGEADSHLEVELAVQEALANSIVHGCKCDASLTVDCWASYVPSAGLLVVISDPGPGFNPEGVPDPKRGENLGFDHGRGVFLVRKLMSKVHYRRNGSEIHMLKY